MTTIILIGLITICLILSYSPKENSKSIINKARVLIRVDSRKVISLILVVTYLYLIFDLNEFKGELSADADYVGYASLILGKIFGSILYGVFVPFLLSLFFSKERKGISFNITAIITNYICIVAYII